MTDDDDLTRDLDDIESRSRAAAALTLTLDTLPALDERPMIEQLEGGLEQMSRAMRLFTDADNVLDIVRVYALTWTHRYGAGWPESTEAQSILGLYRVGHRELILEQMTPIQHTRAFYPVHDSASLEAHLTVAHGFDDASSWTSARMLAGHAAIHHVLPTRADG